MLERCNAPTHNVYPSFSPSVHCNFPTVKKKLSSIADEVHGTAMNDGLDAGASRVFPTGRKYLSLLGDFSSRTTELVLKIPNRPRCCTPLDTLQKPSATAEHKQKREANETECQTSKFEQANGIRSITLRESKGSGQRHVCPHRENHTTEERRPETDAPQP